MTKSEPLPAKIQPLIWFDNSALYSETGNSQMNEAAANNHHLALLATVLMQPMLWLVSRVVVASLVASACINLDGTRCCSGVV